MKEGFWRFLSFCIAIVVGRVVSPSLSLDGKTESADTTIEAGSTTETILTSTDTPTSNPPDSLPTMEIWPRNNFEAIVSTICFL